MAKQENKQLNLVIDDYSSFYHSIRTLNDENYNSLEELFGENDDILEQIKQAKDGKDVDPSDTDDFDLGLYEAFGFSDCAEQENSLVVSGIIPSSIDKDDTFECQILNEDGDLLEGKKFYFGKILNGNFPNEHLTKIQNTFQQILKNPGVYSCMYVVRNCLSGEAFVDINEDFNPDLLQLGTFKYTDDFNYNGNAPLNKINEKLKAFAYNNKSINIPTYSGASNNVLALQLFIFKVNADGTTTVLAKLKDKEDSKYIRKEFFDELNNNLFNK